MAYHDALFQLGMDLTRSSPAQTEEFGETSRLAHEPGPTSFTTGERREISTKRECDRPAGTHLSVDLFGAQGLDDEQHIERTLELCAEKAQAELFDIHLHRFTPAGGVSGVAVLLDSHISIRTWPESDYAAIDLFMCGDKFPHLCVDVLREAFQARNVIVKTHARGLGLEREDVASTGSSTRLEKIRKAA